MSLYTGRESQETTLARSGATQARAEAHVAIPIDATRAPSPCVDALVRAGFVNTTATRAFVEAQDPVIDNLVGTMAVFDHQDALPEVVAGEGDITDAIFDSASRSRDSVRDSVNLERLESAGAATQDAPPPSPALAGESIGEIDDTGRVSRYWPEILHLIAFPNRAAQTIGVELARLLIQAGLRRPALYATRVAMIALFFYGLVVLSTQRDSGRFKSFPAFVGAAVLGYAVKELSTRRAT